jgi:hypothetical protein
VRVGAPLQPWLLRRRSCSRLRPEVYAKGVVYFVAKPNGDTLSQEGGLHAAHKGKGNINGPGPQMADAAGGRQYEGAGGRHLLSRLQAEGGKT